MTAGQAALLALAVVAVFWMLGAYNRLVALRNAIGDAWAQVDSALAERAAAVAPLVSGLRGPLAGEGAALDALLSGQAQVAAAADALRPRPVLAEQAAALVLAEAALGAAAARVLALLDLQPALRADPDLAPHVAALQAAGPRLAFTRGQFNEAVMAYNDAARQFPTRLLTRLYGFGTAGRL